VFAEAGGLMSYAADYAELWRPKEDRWLARHPNRTSPIGALLRI
jgi:hypothetical protein